MKQEEPKQDLPIVNGSYGCTIKTKKQEPKQETLEEFIKKAYLSRLEDCLSVDFEDGVKLGAKWKQQQGYSEEEVENILIEYVKTNPTKPYRVISWFREFKNK